MKTLSYCVILCACLISACQKAAIPPDQNVDAKITVQKSLTEYIIRKGNHYSDQTEYQLISTNAIRAKVKFDNSAIYTSKDAVNQGDVNKLVGFSDCGTNHHQNSARLGWSWNGKDVMLYAYAYVDSVRIIKTLGAVNLNESFSCSVSTKGSYYYFTMNNYSDSIPAHCVGYTGSRYKLFPYFGGDEIAPHDIRIALTEE
ncbi:MAG: hypothetical protein WKF97_10180 [Chitinophagaceae bacterium]